MFFYLFALTAIRNVSIFVKFGAIGAAFMAMIVIFILGWGFYSISNTTYVFGLGEGPDPELHHHSDPSFISTFNTGFAPLMGIFMGGYQLHNMAIPIIRDSKDPSKNSRDVFIGYLLAFAIYWSCGFLGYLGFSGSSFDGKPITEDALNMFPQNNVIATIVRVFTFLHISTSMCLIFAMERSMIFLVLYNKTEV